MRSLATRLGTSRRTCNAPAELVVEGGDRLAAVRGGVRLVPLDLDPAARDRLDSNVELVTAVGVDVVDEDLLGVAVAQGRHDLPTLVPSGDVSDDLPRLGRAVQLVGQARCSVDLQGPVPVFIDS